MLCHLEPNLHLLLSDAFTPEQRHYLSYSIPYAVESLEKAEFPEWRERCLEGARDCRPGCDGSDLLDRLILLGGAERGRQQLEGRLEAIQSSRPYRLGSAVLAPLRWARRHGRSHPSPP